MRATENEIVDILSADIIITKPVFFDVPFYDATMGPFDRMALVILSLTDSDGIREDMPINSSAVPYLENILLPELLKSRQIAYPDLIKKLFWSIRNEGFRGNASVALGQLDMLLHALFAKKKNQTLRAYFGSPANTVAAYASGGSVKLPKEALVAEMQAYADAGYKSLKMKIGRGGLTNIQEDLDRVKAVRAAIGPDIDLSVDANQVYTVEEAIRVAKRCEEFNLSWFEEPVAAANLLGIQMVCDSTSIPIAYGESERSGWVAPSLVETGIKHLQVIPGYLTTMEEWLLSASLASKQGLDFSSGGFSHINCQWVSIASQHATTEFLIPVISHLEGFFKSAPHIQDGEFILTDIPGTGVEINWAHIKDQNMIASNKHFPNTKS